MTGGDGTADKAVEPVANEPSPLAAGDEKPGGTP